MDELVGAAEIARRHGEHKANLAHSWRKRYPEFPEPVAGVQGRPGVGLARHRAVATGQWPATEGTRRVVPRRRLGPGLLGVNPGRRR